MVIIVLVIILMEAVIIIFSQIIRGRMEININKLSSISKILFSNNKEKLIAFLISEINQPILKEILILIKITTIIIIIIIKKN